MLTAPTPPTNYPFFMSKKGTAVHYDVAEVVDPLVHVVARIEKKALAGLGRN